MIVGGLMYEGVVWVLVWCSVCVYVGVVVMFVLYGVFV